MSAALEAAWLALAAGSGAYTITSTKIAAPLRTAVVKRLIRARRADDRTGPWQWLSDLLACPYCVSHWLAFVAVLIYRPWLVDSGLGAVGRVADFVVTSLVVVVGAMAAVWLIKHTLAPVGGPEPGPPSPMNRPATANPARTVAAPPGGVRPATDPGDPAATQVLGGAHRKAEEDPAQTTVMEPIRP